jgi:hypothetical protein
MEWMDLVALTECWTTQVVDNKLQCREVKTKYKE